MIIIRSRQGLQIDCYGMKMIKYPIEPTVQII
jgi:hypothetical protein